MFKVLLCVTHQHNDWLVLLAALVCAPATLATFFIYSKTPPFPAWSRWGWLTMTGLVSGCGIWTTHFVAMLAFKTGLATGYDLVPTAGSLGVAVVSTTLGFALGSWTIVRSRPRLLPLCGGLLVGLGITFMHYIGMSGYRTTGTLHWDLAYVAASVAIGAALAAAALNFGRPGAGAKQQAIAGGLLSLGIVGMHFTGMAAVTITPDARLVVPASLMSNAAMVVAAVSVTGLIIITAIAGVAFDTASRNGNLKRLREALDVMPEGLAFYDSANRLVAWNTRYADLCQYCGAELFAGMQFDELLKAKLIHGAYPDAIGREAEWLAERKAAYLGQTAGLTQKTSNGRWLRVTERRTSDGGTVSVSVDITDLKLTEEAMAQARDQAEELARRAEAAEAIAGLGHWRLDARTNQVIWSPQMYRIYGFDVGAPLDLAALMEMTHPDDRETGRERLQRQLAEGFASEQTTRIVRANGQVRFLQVHSSSERSLDGQVAALIGTVVDITDQVLAQRAIAESEERFRRMAVNAPDIITESRLDGVLTYVSPAIHAITGFTPEELTGQNILLWAEPEDARKVRDMCETVFASKGAVATWPVEFRARHKDGHQLWLECKPTFATDPATGRFTGLNDVIRDITPRKALEAQLRAAQAEAEAAAAVKGEFLANMSHELRTPLTSIIGFTGLAAEQPELSDQTRSYVERVGDASRALLCTVNDILDFSKLEAGQVAIQVQPVALAKITRASLDLFTPQAGAKDLDLALDAGDTPNDLVVAIDPDRVRQVLLNLVGNAVKFTQAGGVTLKARYDAGAQRLNVEVIDTGEGIPEDRRDRLFQRFSQVDGSSTRAQGGTGLGLAICKGLVEAMGGRIGVESQVGAGSRFWFEIPAPRASALPETASEAPLADRPNLAGVRVLVVDDNLANRDLARLFLTGVGAEVTEAVDGEDAVRQAAERPFDVVLMDIRMPKLGGRAALQQIRSTPGPNDTTPILAFTADATASLTQKLKAMGFDDLVAKPLEAGDLIKAVARATMYEPLVQPQDFAHVG